MEVLKDFQCLAQLGIEPGTICIESERATNVAIKTCLERGPYLDNLMICIRSDCFAITMHAPKGILSRFAFFNSYYWKIAGLKACYFQWNSWKLLSLVQGLKH